MHIVSISFAWMPKFIRSATKLQFLCVISAKIYILQRFFFRLLYLILTIERHIFVPSSKSNFLSHFLCLESLKLYICHFLMHEIALAFFVQSMPFQLFSLIFNRALFHCIIFLLYSVGIIVRHVRPLHRWSITRVRVWRSRMRPMCLSCRCDRWCAINRWQWPISPGMRMTRPSISVSSPGKYSAAVSWATYSPTHTKPNYHCGPTPNITFKWHAKIR